MSVENASSLKGKNDRKKKKMVRLGTKLTVIFTIPAILLLTVFCYFSIKTSNGISYKNIKSSLVGQAKGKNDTVSGMIMPVKNGMTSDMLSARISSQTKNQDKDAMYASLQSVTDEIKSKYMVVKDSAIALFDDKVIVRSSSGLSVLTFTEDWYDEVQINKGEPYYQYTSIINNSSASMVTYVCPIKNTSGNIFGAVVFEFNQNSICNTLGLSTSFENQFTFFMDIRKNNLIYHSGKYNPEIFSKIESSLDASAILDENAVNAFNNSKYVTHAFEVTALPGVMCVYSINIDEINHDTKYVNYILIILAACCIIFIAVFVKISSSKIISEVKGISGMLSRIAERNYSERMTPNSNDEVGALVEEFNEVIETLKYQAEHDQKTDFYNSVMFSQKAAEFVNTAQSERYCIVRIDIDNFSFINDIFDWEVGNEILVKISKIVKEVFSAVSVYGYFGNDVFMVCVGYSEKEKLYGLIKTAFYKIKSCEDRIPITAHFGLYDGVRPDSDINVLCDYAGIALKTVKGNLLEIYAEYDQKFEEKHEIQKFVESNKNSALENRDFYIQLQPKCNIHTGEVVGAEALVRWRDPKTAKVISPAKFIPIFEKNGFIITLDRYVWEETCKAIQKWRDHGYSDIPVSVNVSRMHIFHKDFVDDFEKLVRKYGIPPKLIEIEVTESALLENIDGILSDVLSDLKSRGFRILMDDFASGYSSLIALQKFPFDVIKVDKALIDNINEEDNKQFVAGIISFLQDLKKEIVVEGVEHDWQKELLKDTGCEIVQGFCFSVPVSVDKFEEIAFGSDVTD